MKKISQQHARFLQKRVVELEAVLYRQKNVWSHGWVPGWTNFASATLNDVLFSEIQTARILGHAVIVVPKGAGSGTDVLFYADDLEKK